MNGTCPVEMERGRKFSVSCNQLRLLVSPFILRFYGPFLYPAPYASRRIPGYGKLPRDGPRTKTPLWRVRISQPPGFCFPPPQQNQLFCRPRCSSGTNQWVDPLTSRQPQHPLLFCPGFKSSLAELCAQGPQDQLICWGFTMIKVMLTFLTPNKHLRYLK